MQTQSPKQQLFTMRVLWLSFLGTVVMLFFVGNYVLGSQVDSAKMDQDIVNIFAVAGFILIAAGFLIPTLLTRISAQIPLFFKFIISLVLIESAALFGLVLITFTGPNTVSNLLFLCAALAMALKWPTEV